MNDGDKSPDRSTLDNGDQELTSFNEIYTYPLAMDYYDFDIDQQQFIT